MVSCRLGFYRKATANIDDTMMLVQRLLQFGTVNTELSEEAIQCFQVQYRRRSRFRTAQAAQCLSSHELRY